MDNSKLLENISVDTPDSSLLTNSFNNQEPHFSNLFLKRINAVTRSQAKVENKNPLNVQINSDLQNSIDNTSHNNSSTTNSVKENQEEQAIIDKNVSTENIIQVTDPEHQLKLIKEFHDTPLGGHQGIQRTYKRLRKYYYFPKMLGMIERFIKSCESCQKNKVSPVTKMPMMITTSSSKPFERVFLDIVGPLISSYRQNKYILTVMDDLTKYAIAIPIPNQEAGTIADAFLNNFICIYGCPQSILTDQGGNFMGLVLQNLCKLLKIKKINTTAYHPESNGTLERSHRTLIEYLRHFIDKNGMDWDSWIKYSMFVYNTTPHSTIKFMPYELVFGMLPNLPFSFQNDTSIVYNYDDYLADFKHKMQTSYAIAKENAMKSKHNSKIYYDRDSTNKNFQVGDLVWLKNENKITKLSQNWLGPYKIIEIVSPVNSKIEIGKSKKIVHNNRIKLKL